MAIEYCTGIRGLILPARNLSILRLDSSSVEVVWHVEHCSAPVLLDHIQLLLRVLLSLLHELERQRTVRCKLLRHCTSQQRRHVQRRLQKEVFSEEVQRLL